MQAGLGAAARNVNTFAASIRTPGASVSVAMQQASAGVAGVGRQAQAAQLPFRGLLGSAAAIHPALGGLAAMANPVTGGIAAMGAAGAYAVSQFASFESTLVAFETMLGSAEKAKAYLKDLQQFAARTPFQFQDLTGGAQRLIAMGFSAEEAREMMEPLGNLASAMPGDMGEGFERITRAIGQMKSKGKVQAQEMTLQLAEAGIPAWQALATHMGMSVAEVQKLSEQGKIAASTGIQAILNLGKSSKFSGLMDKRSMGLEGMWSTAKDNWQIFNVGIGEAIAKGSNLHRVMQDLNQQLTKLATDKSFQKGVGDLARVAGGALEAVGLLAKGLDGLNQTFKKDFKLDGGMFEGWSKLLEYTPNLYSGAQGLKAMFTGGEDNWWSTLLKHTPNIYAAGHWGMELFGGKEQQVVQMSATRGVTQHAAAVQQQTAASRQALQVNEAMKKSVGDLYDELRLQTNTFGMASAEANVWKLKQKGASDEQVKMLESLARQNELLDQWAKLNGDLVPALNIYDEFSQKLQYIKQLGKEGFLDGAAVARGVKNLEKEFLQKEQQLGLQYFKAAATPMDKFFSSTQELARLQERGIIGDGIADSGLFQAFKQMEGSLKLGETQLPDAMQEGSKAALSFIAKRESRGAETVQQQIARTLKDGQRIQKEQAEYERQAAAALREILGKVGPVAPAKF